MELRISIDGPEGDDSLLSLYRWLAQDPDVGRKVKVSLAAAPPIEGQMSGAFEAINAVIANVIALGGLLLAVDAWRKSRSAALQVRIEKDGTSITMDGNSADEITEIASTLMESPSEGGTPSTGVQGP